MSGGAQPSAATGRRSWRVVMTALLAALLMLGLCGVAARGGSWTSSRVTSAPTREAPAPAPSEASPPPRLTAPPSGRATKGGGSVLAYLVVAFVLAFLVLALVLLVWLLPRPAWRRWARRPRIGTATGALAHFEDEALPAAVTAALRVLSDQPEAREAVIRAWLSLVEAAAAAGTPSVPSETAGEYARRLAAEHRLPVAELEQLASLYREARFSEHEMRTVHRDAAHCDLLALQAALADRVDSGVPR